MIQVTGLDLSLTNTGICSFREDFPKPIFASVGTDSLGDDPTLRQIADRIQEVASRTYRAVMQLVEDGDDVWFIFEAPSFASQFGKPDERSGLRWSLAQAFKKHGEIMQVPPSNAKQFWTGNGSADKPMMLKFAKLRWPELGLRDHNAADALALASIGAHHRGLDLGLRPPATNPDALAKVRWPDPIQETK